MPKKKTEHLAWEIRLIAPPGTRFAMFEDEDPMPDVMLELGVDTQWPDLWLEVPYQPDFGGRSAKAQAWLDNEAPMTGLYRLRRMVDQQIVTVQMVKTIQSRPVQAEIDLTVEVKDQDEAGENIAPDALADVAEKTKVIDLDSHRTTTGQEPDTAGSQTSSASEGEATEPATSELDLADMSPPTDDGTIIASRSVWMAAPLRRCRSMQACCFCDEDIVSGQHYYDRGYGKRAHQACVEKQHPEEAPF
jgi:hypothetical protein